jgi:hypothetical protein
LGVASQNVYQECFHHSPLSLALTEEKAVRLNVAVKDEIVIVARETGFQEVSEDAVVELLESRSVILMNEEPAWLDMRTCKGA